MNKLLLLGKIFLISSFWCVYLLFISTIFDVYRADLKAVNSKEVLGAGDSAEAYILAQEAVALNPYRPYYYKNRAQVLLISFMAADAVPPEEIKEQIFNDLQKSLVLNPENLASLRNNIPLYYYLALENLSVENSEENMEVF